MKQTVLRTYFTFLYIFKVKKYLTFSFKKKICLKFKVDFLNGMRNVKVFTWYKPGNASAKSEMDKKGI